MQIFEVHPVNPHLRLMKKVVELLQAGGLVIFPTDSGYSVGCLASQKKAVQRLYETTRSEKIKLMSLMVPHFSVIPTYADVDNVAFRTMKNHLPGPFTFILQATKEGKKILEVKRDEIGVRMPDHPFFKTFHDLCEDAILCHSARLDDSDGILDPDELSAAMQGQVDALVSMGRLAEHPTTVVSLVSGEPELIRQGVGIFP